MSNTIENLEKERELLMKQVHDRHMKLVDDLIARRISLEEFNLRMKEVDKIKAEARAAGERLNQEFKERIEAHRADVRSIMGKLNKASAALFSY